MYKYSFAGIGSARGNTIADFCLNGRFSND